MKKLSQCVVKAVQRGRLSVAGSSMVDKMGVEFFFSIDNNDNNKVHF